jgi:hypothetical protein
VSGQGEEAQAESRSRLVAGGLWQLTEVVLDAGLTVGLDDIRTGRLEAGAVEDWLEEWRKKLRVLTHLEEEDGPPS